MKKNTSRALLMSFLSLFLCVTMLLGTTFAWFTDEVTSTNNIIKSGTLDVEFEYSTDMANWTVMDANSNVFKEGALWEPGYSEVVYLRVTNKGDLALKYLLKVNVAEETKGTNRNDEEFKLSDYIMYGVVSTDAKYTSREAAVDAVTEPVALNKDFGKAYEMQNNGDVHTYALIAYMPEEVGNVANHKPGAAFKPEIKLGVGVYATQLTHENDSFDNMYDTNAPYSVWDGVVPTEMPESLVVDGETQTIYVKDAAAFAYLGTLSDKWADFYTDGNGREYGNYANGAGANYYYSGKWTISLEANIDLNNYAIDPVKLVIGESTGASAFKGNSNTIRNINTTTGLFADSNRASYDNLNLLNVTATNGALTGSSTTSINKVNVKNANIGGTDYVGGLVGYTYGEVTDCSVIDSSVVASGKEAGGLIGYAATSTPEGHITSNTVRNVSVYAGNRAAGLAGQVNVNIKVYGNTIDTVTVGAEDITTYQPDAVVSNALDAANVYDNTVINSNVASSKIILVSDQADFKDAIKNATDDTTLILTDNVTATTTDWDRYTGGMSNAVSIDGCGNTIKIQTQITDPNYQAVLRFEKDAVVKNIVFDLSNANPNGTKFRAISSKGDLVVDNCTFIGNPNISNTRGIIFGEGSGDAIGEVDVTITNCTFVDFTRGITDNENGKDVKNVSIENCKFTNAGVNVSAGNSITFIDNELISSDVRLVSYQNGDTVKVTALGNDVSASANNTIAIMKVTNTANITKQDEFIIY